MASVPNTRSQLPSPARRAPLNTVVLERRRVAAAESTVAESCCFCSPFVPNNGPCWRLAARASKLVASVAQLVEQLTLNQLVLGSSPSRGTDRNRLRRNFPDQLPRWVQI